MLTKQSADKIFATKGITLKTASSRAVDHLAIPKSSKRFLKEIGLPPQADLMLTFDFDPDYLPTLAEFALKRNKPATAHMATLRRIGTDYGTELCIDEVHGGEFVGIPIRSESAPSRFLNSSIEKFAECLAIYYKYAGTAKGMTDDETRKIVAREEAEMRAVDSRAFVGRHIDNLWWPLIIEQMRNMQL